LSAQQSIYDVALSHSTDCGKYLGFSAWSSSERECVPTKQSLKNDIALKMSENIETYLSSYKFLDLEQKYVFSVLEPFFIVGVPGENAISGTKEFFELTEEEIAALTISQQELKEKIIKKADELGIPRDIALGLAFTESRLQHTINGKLNIGKNGADTGLFQINVDVHRDCRTDDENLKKKLLEEGYLKNGKMVKVEGICIIPECKGKTVADVDCNIAAGLRYLKRLHDTAGPSLTYCPNDPELRVVYTDPWEIAFRRYNGLQCGNRFVKYVKIVENNRKAFA